MSDTSRVYGQRTDSALFGSDVPEMKTGNTKPVYRQNNYNVNDERGKRASVENPCMGSVLVWKASLKRSIQTRNRACMENRGRSWWKYKCKVPNLPELEWSGNEKEITVSRGQQARGKEHKGSGGRDREKALDIMVKVNFTPSFLGSTPKCFKDKNEIIWTLFLRSSLAAGWSLD